MDVVAWESFSHSRSLERERRRFIGRTFTGGAATGIGTGRVSSSSCELDEFLFLSLFQNRYSSLLQLIFRGPGPLQYMRQPDEVPVLIA